MNTTLSMRCRDELNVVLKITGFIRACTALSSFVGEDYRSMFKDGDKYRYYTDNVYMSSGIFRRADPSRTYGMPAADLNKRQTLVNCIFLVTHLSLLIYSRG